MGICPHCGADVTVKAELVDPDAVDDDHVSMGDEGPIQLGEGTRMYQYLCPSCDVILGAGTHKWVR